MALQAKKKLAEAFGCKGIGEMAGCAGCAAERGKGWLKVAQPAGLRKAEDELDPKKHLSKGRAPPAPAEPGKMLSQGEQGEEQSKEDHKAYQSGCGLLLHAIRWARQEALSDGRELAGHMQKLTTKHVSAMYRCMDYFTTLG